MAKPGQHELQKAASAYERRRVCVTGGGGFIGSHLVDAMIAGGAEVAVIDDFSTGLEVNLALAGDQIHLVRGSILDDNALERAMRGVEIVFHQAALASVPRSVEQPAMYVDANVTGTLRVLEAARNAGAKRVVYAASSSAYGEQPGQPRVETMPGDPLSPYAASKLAGEHLLRAYASCYDLSAVSLRYFNIFGPRQRADSPYAAVIPLFASALLDGRTPIVFGDGTQTRDFTYVANAVYANLLAGSADRELKGEVMNVGCGESISVLALLEAAARELGVEPKHETQPPRVGEVQESCASIDRARAMIGYVPIVSFDEGLRQTIAHYRTAYARV